MMSTGGTSKRYRQLRFLLPVFPILMAVLCLGIGKYALTPAETARTLYYSLIGNADRVSSVAYSVVMNLRLPRVLLALFAGAALSAAGVAYQSVFSNPLAAPDTLGTSAGAGCGACIGLLLNLPSLAVQGLAFVGGLLAVGCTYALSRSRRQSGTVLLVLSGIAVSALFQAMISIIQLVADPTEKLPEITYWLMGSLSRANYNGLAWGLPTMLIGCAVLFALRWRLNLLALEDSEAISMGIPVKTLRGIVIVAATCCTAACVSLCGMVGWLGILAPHMARMLVGNDNRYTLPTALSLGAVSLLLMDTLARNIVSGEVPISVLTALVGAPAFLFLLRKSGGVRL